jgi:sigma-B regulation protein RsbU (phosphoserine phosphatase)
MSAASLLEPKLLYRHLDDLFGRLDASGPTRVVLPTFLRETFATLAEDFGLRTGWLYAERRGTFELAEVMGEDPVAGPDELDAAQAPLADVLRHGVYLFDHLPPAEEDFQPDAAVAVGGRPGRHVLCLRADGWSPRGELDFALNTIRAALGARMQDDRVRGSVRQAAEIQRSLLLEEPPTFPGFELAMRSVPADEVGGDFYDFLSSPADAQLGFAVGDASGHGLPAALLVRDVVTGLRMGMERELKVAHVFGKLNRVIHRSNLSSRFISVFYGELEDDGHLIYVNAGHPAGLLFSGPRVAELTTGGTVIGPLPEVRFRRGVARLAPLDVLVLLTDGILEHPGPEGEFFGEARVRASVRARLAQSADEILEGLFADVRAWGEERPFDDDATVMVIKRCAARS